MKKLCLAVTAVIVAMLCVGASIWEGAAAVSISGELPEGGYYAATKSFPRNTVVDITNLETGKSVRVIVAAGLDSPGLLAILSREAAEIIGIQTRSIGRIRMTMPSDPIAFSRFTEGSNPNGDPDHDPRAAIAAASARQSPPAAPQRPIIPSGTAAESGNMPPPVWEAPDLPAPTTEWAPEPPPDTVPPAGDPVIPAEIPAPPENVLWPWELPTFSSQAERPVETSPESAPVTDPFLSSRSEEIPAVSSPESTYMPPAAAQPDRAITYERGPELIRQPAQENTTRSVIALEPAEARPPEPYTTLPPGSEITPITSPSANPVATTQPREDVQIPEQYIIPGIAEAASKPPEAKPEPSQPPITETVRNDPVSSNIEAPVSAGTPAVQFSAPVINTLEKGMYYLQLRAFSKTDLVQAELTRLGDTYPLAIQTGGTQENPLYRVLVGPVNLGESNALLRRFKGNGYGDAFIKQAE